MMKYLVAYGATAVAMFAIDMLWLGVIAKPLYQQGIGHLMADRPNLPVAALFYAVFPIGLMFFAVAPGGLPAAWSKTLLAGAMFGFFAYATYDLTNLATLKGWPVGLSVIDTLWGTVVSAVAAAAGKVTFDQFFSA